MIKTTDFVAVSLFDGMSCFQIALNTPRMRTPANRTRQLHEPC